MKLVKKFGVIVSLATVGVTVANVNMPVSAKPVITVDAETEQTLESIRIEDADELNSGDIIKRYADKYIDSGYKVFDLNTIRDNNIELKDFKNLDGDGILVLNSYYPNVDIIVKKMSKEEFIDAYCGGNSINLNIANRIYYDNFGRVESEVLYDSIGETIVITHHRFNSNAVEFAE